MTTTAITARSAEHAPARVWTIDEIRGLGTTVNVATAGAILGIGRSKSYELAKNGEFPVRVLRIGRRYLVPTLPILALLGID
ncbi:MAG: helix-turn-helix domain-containing protein [Dactylosporangium sp.]|nr:helix-turn-helix domain-containing protein [Dactylosporangium sp.]NNJ63482.1 helix-turn-helix domain-containing protein [Dactylosporangium sp.]